MKNCSRIIFCSLLCWLGTWANVQGQDQDYIITLLGDSLPGYVTKGENWSKGIYFGFSAGDTSQTIPAGSLKRFSHAGNIYIRELLPNAEEGNLIEPFLVRKEAFGDKMLHGGSGPWIWVNPIPGKPVPITGDGEGNLSAASTKYLRDLLKSCEVASNMVQRTSHSAASVRLLLETFENCPESDDIEDIDLTDLPPPAPSIFDGSYNELGNWFVGPEFGVQATNWVLSSDLLPYHNLTITDEISPFFGLLVKRRLVDKKADLFAVLGAHAQPLEFAFSDNVPDGNPNGSPIFTLNYEALLVNGTLGLRLAGSKEKLRGFIELGGSAMYVAQYDFFERYITFEEDETEPVRTFSVFASDVNDLLISGYGKIGITLNRAEIFAQGQFYPEVFTAQDIKNDLYMVGLGLSFWIF